MTLEQMKRKLSLNKIPDCFLEYYRKIKDCYIEQTEQMLSETVIRETLEDCHVLSDYLPSVLTAAEKIRENDEMRLFLCLLTEYIAAGGDPRSGEYEAPGGEGLEYDFLHLFPAIPTMQSSVASLKKRGVPDEIIWDTMKEYDTCVQNCEQYLGRSAFDHRRLGWIRLLIQNSLIRIGRLKYELPQKKSSVLSIRVYQNKAGELAVLADGVRVHKDGMLLGCPGFENEDQSFYAEISETEETVSGHPVKNGLIEAEKTTLKKADWTLVLTKDDPVVNIHIPADGRFDRESIEASYAKTREILNRCYPDYPYKAFFCASWLLSVSLQKLLKSNSNILAFQKTFTLFPYPAYGTGVFQFVFPEQGKPKDYNTLPEDTSLQRAVKETYLAGGFIHEFSGFFF